MSTYTGSALRAQAKLASYRDPTLSQVCGAGDRPPKWAHPKFDYGTFTEQLACNTGIPILSHPLALPQHESLGVTP